MKKRAWSFRMVTSKLLVDEPNCINIPLKIANIISNWNYERIWQQIVFLSGFISLINGNLAPFEVSLKKWFIIRQSCHPRSPKHFTSEVKLCHEPGLKGFNLNYSYIEDLSINTFEKFRDNILKIMSRDILFSWKIFFRMSFWHGIRWKTTSNDIHAFYFTEIKFYILSFFSV